MHCYHDFVDDLNHPGDQIIIGAGIHDLCVDPKVGSKFWQVSYVKKIHHTGTYEPESFDNDIAILEVANDLVMNDIIQPVCLPKRQYQPGDVCFVSGWGHDASE